MGTENLGRFYVGFLSERIRSLGDEWARRDEHADSYAARRLLESLRDFPYELLEDERLPLHREDGQDIRIFPLGDYGYTWMNRTRGRTTLHLGNDHRLYEYGPARISDEDDEEEEDFTIATNLIALRRVEFRDLSVSEIHACCDLLVQVSY